MGVTKTKYSGSTLTLNLSPSHRYDRNSHAQFLFATQCKREISFIAIASDHQSMLGKKLALSTTKNLPFLTLSPITDPNNKVVISSKHVQDQLGRDSPGVGAYQFEDSVFNKSMISKSGLIEAGFGTS
jgi:hypothetical protein